VASNAAPEGMLRALIPPLTISLTLVTALALILTAAAIVPAPLTAAVAPPAPPLPSAAATPEVGVIRLIDSALIALPPAPMAIGLARLIYQPGRSGPLGHLPGPLLLAMESGTLAATLDGAAQRVPAPGPPTGATGDILLHAGDALVVPTTTAAAFHSAGAQPAVVLAAGVFPSAAVGSGFGPSDLARGPGAAPHWSLVWSPAASVTRLAGGWAANLTAPTGRITLTRLTLPAGASTAVTTLGTQALAVEAGVLTLAAEHGLIGVAQPEDGDRWLSPGATATLLPGDSAMLQHTASATLRNDGRSPLQLLILDLTPVATP
jgi:hypothetical protein